MRHSLLIIVQYLHSKKINKKFRYHEFSSQTIKDKNLDASRNKTGCTPWRVSVTLNISVSLSVFFIFLRDPIG